MTGLANSAVGQALLLLPGWVGWAGPAAYLLVVASAGAVASRLVARLALQGIDIDAESHWTERYQRTHPARIASSLVMLLFPLIAIALAEPWQGLMSIVPENVLFVAASAVAVGSCIPAPLDLLFIRNRWGAACRPSSSGILQVQPGISYLLYQPF